MEKDGVGKWKKVELGNGKKMELGNRKERISQR